MKALRIAVVGCGPAGQSAALFLAKAGHKVEIFEKVAKLGPVGAGFLLQPTAFVALKKLGLYEEINALGSRIDLLFGRTKAERTVLKLPYAEIDPRLYGLGMMRSSLCSVFEKEMARLAIPVHFDADVDSLDLEGKVSLVSKGKTHKDFELVIVAEGARSPLRDKYFRNQVTRDWKYGWGTLYAVVDDDEGFFESQHTLYQIFEGTKKMMGVMPSGYAMENGKRSEKPKVTLFWSLHKEMHPTWAATESLGEWKEKVTSLYPKASRIVSKVSSKGELPFATYSDVRMSQYHNAQGNSVVIGDAAHAMSPVLGQGINFALLDAMTLTESLAIHTTLSGALNHYTKTRKQALRFYQFVSRSINPWFQSSNIPGMSLSRDLFFNPFTHIPVVRKQLLLTQIGAKSGLFPLLSLDQTIQWKHWEL